MKEDLPHDFIDNLSLISLTDFAMLSQIFVFLAFWDMDFVFHSVTALLNPS